MRAAAVDIGTNSVLLTVGERLQDGTIVSVSDTLELTRLGQGVDQNQRLNDEAVARTLEALERCATEASSHGARRIAAVATSATRDAENGTLFLQQATRALGGPVEVISGDREARLCYAGVDGSLGPLQPDTATPRPIRQTGRPLVFPFRDPCRDGVSIDRINWLSGNLRYHLVY